MKNKSRFFRFGLKTFLIFVFVCGVMLAWFSNVKREHRTEIAAISHIQATASQASFTFSQKGPRNEVMHTVLFVK